jgi:hypothetical protein
MKRKFIRAILALSIICTATVACTDDYTEREVEYSIGSDNYFNSEEDYNKALIAAYDILQSTYVNVILGEIASDNTVAGGESATDVVGWQQVDLMTHTSINANVRNIWDWMFAGVNRASYILEFKDKTPFDGKDQIIAEARFLRAYYHFELVKWFGGIPMKGDFRFALGDETKIPRSSKEQVYAAIESDLLQAIEDLSPDAKNVGRVTKGAAQALLGKVYLYQQKYVQAGEMLDHVINDYNYKLAQGQAYQNLFEEAGENGLESVFEVQYTDVEGAGFECLQCSEGNVAVGFSGPRGFSGPLFSSGYSFNLPVQTAVEIFEADEPRRDVTILDIEEFAAENAGFNDGEGVEYGEGYNHTGYYNRKYIPRKRSSNAAGDLNLTNPNNYRAIRYADVLLMAAEAFSSADPGKARGYLNEVRRRAYGDTDHDETAATATALRNIILEERRKELFGEGHRFFDLVRTGQAKDKITGFVEGKNEVFPIPLEEIQFSNNLWSQNPNY